MTQISYKMRFVAAILFVALPNLLQAALVATDDPMYGVGSITRDTSTGIQWLDVPLSQGRTYLDVAGEFGPGDDFPGFRHATAAELSQLYVNAGIPDINTPDPTVANLVPATALSQLVGPTSMASGNPQTFGFLSDPGGPLAFQRRYRFQLPERKRGVSCQHHKDCSQRGDCVLHGRALARASP